jgi:aminopeptidase S
LPANSSLTLSFSYYLAHANNSSSADFLRVKVIGTSTSTVLQVLGTNKDKDAIWATATVNLSAFAGQTVYILIEAADNSSASLVEAAVDDVKIVSSPQIFASGTTTTAK